MMAVWCRDRWYRSIASTSLARDYPDDYCVFPSSSSSTPSGHVELFTLVTRRHDRKPDQTPFGLPFQWRLSTLSQQRRAIENPNSGPVTYVDTNREPSEHLSQPAAYCERTSRQPHSVSRARHKVPLADLYSEHIPSRLQHGGSCPQAVAPLAATITASSCPE
jgi:hypothetical protein